MQACVRSDPKRQIAEYSKTTVASYAPCEGDVVNLLVVRDQLRLRRTALANGKSDKGNAHQGIKGQRRLCIRRHWQRYRT